MSVTRLAVGVLAILLTAGLVGAAFMFRYAPISGDVGNLMVAVWDRWTHRPCIFIPDVGRACYERQADGSWRLEGLDQ